MLSGGRGPITHIWPFCLMLLSVANRVFVTFDVVFAPESEEIGPACLRMSPASLGEVPGQITASRGSQLQDFRITTHFSSEKVALDAPLLQRLMKTSITTAFSCNKIQKERMHEEYLLHERSNA